MRTWIVILISFLSLPSLAVDSHAVAAPTEVPPPELTVRPPSREEIIVQNLWQLRLGLRALDELGRLLQDPAATASPEKFAVALDHFPKGLLTPEQRTKLVEWFAGGFNKAAPAGKRATDLAAAARKVVDETRAWMAGPRTIPGPVASPGTMLAQIESSLKAQLGELQAKVDQALARQPTPTPSVRPGRDRSDILDKLLADAQSDRSGRDSQPPPAAPTPGNDAFGRNQPPSSHENAQPKYPERDGLRFPPRDGRDRGGQNQGQGGNQNGGGGDKQGSDGKEKKDDANKQGQSPFGGGKNRGDDFSSLKKAPEKKDPPKPLPSPTPQMADAAPPDIQIPIPAKPSDLPLAPAAGAFGGAYNAGNLGVFGGGFGGGMASPGLPPPAVALSGDPFSDVGRQDWGGGGEGGVRPSPVGYAGISGPEGSEEPAPNAGTDAVPARESRPTRFRSQVLDPKPGDADEHHWVFDSAGTMVSRFVCDGTNPDLNDFCQTLRFRAKLRRLKKLAPPVSLSSRAAEGGAAIPSDNPIAPALGTF